MTSVVVFAAVPSASVTFSCTLYVPISVNSCDGFWIVWIADPSPKSHCQVYGITPPVVSSVNWARIPALGDNGLTLNAGSRAGDAEVSVVVGVGVSSDSAVTLIKASFSVVLVPLAFVTARVTL